MKVLSFTTKSCQFCKITEPMLEGKAEAGLIELKQIDAEEDVETRDKYGIQSAPTIIVLEEGKEPQRAQGVLEINKMMERV